MVAEGWSVTIVAHSDEVVGLDDPILVEDLGDGYGTYELTRSDAHLWEQSQCAPTGATGEVARRRRLTIS